MRRLLSRSLILIPPDRQRGAPTPDAVGQLASSIRTHSLLHPPVVQPNGDGQYALLAGHTRLLAIDLIHAEGDAFRCGDEFFSPGEVPVLLRSELSEIEAFEIELEENVRRTPLPWQKEADAYARLHKMKLATGLSHKEAVRETQATIQQVAPSDVRDLADAHKTILLGQHLGDADVAKAKNKGDALKIIARKLTKAADLAAPKAAPANVILGDAIAELRKLPAASFDGICSDPPYGIGITQLSYQSSSEQQYDDSYETWQQVVLAGLVPELARVLRPNAVGYLFCDLSRFGELASAVEQAGFEVYPRPLIWDRSPDGRLTTPEKWPRRCYEVILYFRRGTRPLREFRGDVLRHPADRDSANYHGAKKPAALYQDLLERAFGPGDSVLDPFAGSGPLLTAGRALGLSVLLIEGDPAYHSLILRLRDKPNDEPALF